jgi:hypothetical protein
MNKLTVLTNEIADFYPKLQERKKLDSLYKEVLEEKFRETNEKKIIHQGYILQRKSRTKWKWKEETFSFLKEKGVLHAAVKLKKDAIERFVLEDFQYSPESYVRITPKRQTALEKEIEKNDRELLKKELKNKTMEEVINLLKANRVFIKTFEQRYENRKKNVLSFMQSNKMKKFNCTAGHGYSVLDKKIEYDMDTLNKNQVLKRFNFSYKQLNNEGLVKCIDHFTKEEFVFQNETFHDYQRLSIEKGRLCVNGKKLRVDIRSIFEGGFYPATGTILVDNEELFRKSSISSTKIEELLDEGAFTSDEIQAFRYRESASDTSEFFEAISETSDEERRKMFQEKMEKRRALQKQIKIIEQIEDIDQDEDDLFFLEEIV